jgi:hypothetical protein
VARLCGEVYEERTLKKREAWQLPAIGGTWRSHVQKEISQAHAMMRIARPFNFSSLDTFKSPNFSIAKKKASAF